MIPVLYGHVTDTDVVGDVDIKGQGVTGRRCCGGPVLDELGWFLVEHEEVRLSCSITPVRVPVGAYQQLGDTIPGTGDRPACPVVPSLPFEDHVSVRQAGADGPPGPPSQDEVGPALVTTVTVSTHQDVVVTVIVDVTCTRDRLS